MKFNVIVSDPCWSFNDKLTMDSVKRGAESQYDVLNIQAIKALPVEKICANDSLLALWTPSSLLAEGLDVMKSWGFAHKQTFIWVKIKVNPLENLRKKLFSTFKEYREVLIDPDYSGKKHFNTRVSSLISIAGVDEWPMDNGLAFGMGRLFRNTHEIALIGTKGKIYNKLMDRAQRTVHFHMALKHSAKPEGLQDKLDIMFPKTKKLEMFARRERQGWTCVGNECPSSMGEDIRDSLDRLSKRNSRKQRTNENSTIKLQL